LPKAWWGDKPETMHILFLTGEYPPASGGIGDYTRQLASALREFGSSTSVITIQRQQLVCYRGVDPTAQVLAQASGWGWSIMPALRKAIAQYTPDVVHIQYQTGAYAMHPAINLLPWYLRRQPHRPPFVVTFHDLLEPYLFPKAGPLRRWVTTALAAKADAVIATNDADRAILAARLRERVSNVSAIPIGSNIPVAPPADYERTAWRARLGCGPAELLVAYFGLLSPSKGADLLLDALADLPARLLVIGGEATAPQDRAFAEHWAQQVEQRGLNARVFRTGHAEPAQVSAHLLAADMVALPFHDGASFRRGSLLAALAHGCPLITTRPADPTTAQQLRHGEQALLIEPDDVHALRAAISTLAATPALRARLAEAGRNLAAAFAWPTIAQRHLELYRALPG
jgi:polysaccharide biosynthesis protein PslF